MRRQLGKCEDTERRGKEHLIDAARPGRINRTDIMKWILCVRRIIICSGGILWNEEVKWNGRSDIIHDVYLMMSNSHAVQSYG